MKLFSGETEAATMPQLAKGKGEEEGQREREREHAAWQLAAPNTGARNCCPETEH